MYTNLLALGRVLKLLLIKLPKEYITLAIPNVLPKSSCMGTLVLKSGIQCLIKTFVGKTLELPESHNLCTKKTGKLKIV